MFVCCVAIPPRRYVVDPHTIYIYMYIYVYICVYMCICKQIYIFIYTPPRRYVVDPHTAVGVHAARALARGPVRASLNPLEYPVSTLECPVSTP
jgi:hypothetical protein